MRATILSRIGVRQVLVCAAMAAASSSDPPRLPTPGVPLRVLESRARRKLKIVQLRAAAREGKPWLGPIWKFTPAFARMMIILTDMPANDCRAAVDFILCRRTRYKMPARTESEVRELLEALCGSIPQDLRLEMSVRSTESKAKHRQALLKAWNVMLEWRIVQWAMQQHTASGLAPSTSSLLKRYEELREDIPYLVRPWFRGAGAAARAFASRLRRHWCGRFGRLASKVNLTSTELNAKARMGSTIWLFWDLVFGYSWNQFLTPFGTPFWDDKSAHSTT